MDTLLAILQLRWQAAQGKKMWQQQYNIIRGSRAAVGNPIQSIILRKTLYIIMVEKKL